MKKLIIHLNSSFYDEEIDNQFNIWKTGRVFADLGGILHSGLSCADEWKAGKRLYYFVQQGKIQSITGLEHAFHFIEVPIAFANEVHHTEMIPVYNETGEQTSTEEKIVYVGDYYDAIPNLEQTKVLIRLTDSNYKDLIHMIIQDSDGFATNIRTHKNWNEYEDYYQPENIE